MFGISWTKNNSNFLKIEAEPTNRKIFANTDILVSDDLEVYFIDENKILEFQQQLNSNPALIISGIFQRIPEKIISKMKIKIFSAHKKLSSVNI